MNGKTMCMPLMSKLLEKHRQNKHKLNTIAKEATDVGVKSSEL